MRGLARGLQHYAYELEGVEGGEGQLECSVIIFVVVVDDWVYSAYWLHEWPCQLKDNRCSFLVNLLPSDDEGPIVSRD